MGTAAHHTEENKQDCSRSLTMWLSKDCLNSLIYWDNPRDSGIAFGSVLVCLLAVRYISLISVMGNLALALVTATMSFRIYKSVLAAVNKTSEGHPFKQYLEYDVNLPADKVAETTDNLLTTVNNILTRLKTVFLGGHNRVNQVCRLHVLPNLYR